jgi:pimeloyl-ACP methyl ester carboxylesterase
MTTELHVQQWGDGPPVLALHGLGLESSSFTGLAEGVADMGLGMRAADLPGFGQTPAPDAPLSPRILAEPVLELAATLDRPLVMGMSLGARVALEAALVDPTLFRGVVMIAPPLPRRRHRWALSGARLLSPRVAELLPVQVAWPWLKATAERLEAEMDGDPRHDWMLRASRRAVYHVSCPATRRAMVSAARELALDPAWGPDGVWSRLGGLAVPAAFVWGDRDRIVGTANVAPAREALPGAFFVRVPCGGHFDNGPHFLCMEEGALEAVRLVEGVARRPARRRGRAAATVPGPDPAPVLETRIDCVVARSESDTERPASERVAS